MLHGAEEGFAQWGQPLVVGLEPGGELAGGEAVVAELEAAGFGVVGEGLWEGACE